MDTFDAIEQRRSIKHFDKNHKLSESEIEKLLSLAILSPTSYNIQNWRFVLVKDSETRKKIRSAAWDQAQVTDSSLLLVICADLKAWKKQPERYWKTAPKEIQDMFVKMIGDFYDGKEQLYRDEAMRSCGIASQTIMLTAKAMGYDSGAMIGFDSEKVAKIINLPDDHVIGLMVVIGKQIKPASPRGGQLPLSDIVFTDRFI
jgi:nitroreductase